ncbi:MAG: hypothetical protein HY902_11855, partial [Deltaproteobacteria bacterium]|nr:hypothetical protein [Deltaproteobacteria bacterium]
MAHRTNDLSPILAHRLPKLFGGAASLGAIVAASLMVGASAYAAPEPAAPAPATPAP